MALRKKGARRITVDGVVYRWRVREKPTYSQGLGSYVTFAAEFAEPPGATLVVTLAQPHPSNWLLVPAAPITPAQVAESIRIALAQGWIPAQPGSAFLLDRTATD